MGGSEGHQRKADDGDKERCVNGKIHKRNDGGSARRNRGRKRMREETVAGFHGYDKQ